MANAKEKHYWAQLRAALTSGSWDIHSPAQVPKGTPLSWSELLRKFNKHCHGYSDVAELASQTQAISVLLLAQDEDRPSESPLTLGDECTLPHERVEEATAGYTTLQSLRSADQDPVKLCLAYYAFATGRPSECLSILETIKELTDVSTRVLSYSTMHKDGGALQPPDGVASTSTSRTGSFASAWTTGSAGTSAEIADGRAWGMIEAVRSITLQGMSYERLSPNDLDKAFLAYAAVVPLVTAVVNEFQGSFSAPGNTLVTTFPKYRELWRWVERSLRRAIVIAARLHDLHGQGEDSYSLWTLFDLYRACSAHWPPTFRPYLRSWVATIHSRAFVLRARIVPPGILKAKAPRWIISARSVLQEFRSLLNVCTHFPRAGERNVLVEDFVDLCVAVWEADGAVGEQAGWVIDLLWWATRLTFNSFRIYRHMSRLFSASGDRDLALRTLRLYIQVVSKARQTATSGNDSETSSIDAGSEFDTDKQWVQTLVQGSRLLSRAALEENDYGKRVELAKEAGETARKARTRLDSEDKELVASVHVAEGIWYSVTAYVEQNPRTRTEGLTKAIESLTTAVGIFPTASTHHHLALALTRPGPTKDFHQAIDHARSAVELDSGEPRHWHLLCLLLAATEDWKAAKSVLDIGIGLVETELIEEGEPGEQPVVNGDGVNVRDFAHPPSGTTNGSAELSANEDEHVLPKDASDIPPSASLLQPIGDRPRPTHQELFEYALQMRMSQLALTEHVDGVENVSEKWLDVFAWYREKRPAGLDDQRKSIDGGRPSQDTRRTDATSMRSQMTQPARASADIVRPNPVANDAPGDSQPSIPTPIPITITPASPGLSQEDYGASAPASSTPNATNGEKRSTSLDEKDRDTSRGKKVRDVLKSGVHKGQARMVTISKKIGHGVGRSAGLSLKRTISAPDFHSVLGHTSLQASSIHLRQYQSIHASQQDLGLLEVPPPPRAPSPDPASKHPPNTRSSRDARLLSDLWLMSAAIFRRQGKIEQVRGAIQEAEVRDEDNPNVWVQLGLYHNAMSDHLRASEAFRKALFINPDHVPATIYLCQTYLTPTNAPSFEGQKKVDDQRVDLVAGLLSDLTSGPGWDTPEAWYYLAKAYKLQGRRDRERECLNFALTLSQTRGVRDITTAVGWCL